MLASLLAAGMPLGAQNLGSEYRLKRVIPVEGRQGVAADSNFYYVSGSTALYKYDKQGRLAAKNERPFEGLPLAANHIGDIDVWDGEIYAGIETRRMVDDNKIHAIMQANAAKKSKGKKSKFQQRYEELMRQQEAQQRAKRK